MLPLNLCPSQKLKFLYIGFIDVNAYVFWNGYVRPILQITMVVELRGENINSHGIVTSAYAGIMITSSKTIGLYTKHDLGTYATTINQLDLCSAQLFVTKTNGDLDVVTITNHERTS